MKIWIQVVIGVVLGVASSYGRIKFTEYRAAQQLPAMVGKCYTYKDTSLRDLSYVEKVIKTSSKDNTVTTMYTFVGAQFKEFDKHWACLQHVGCDVVNVKYFLYKMNETPCPW